MIMSVRNVYAAFSFVVCSAAFVACDGLAPTGDLQPGFTACGDVTCQPGQYCGEASSGFCLNGCTSDANCEDDRVCQDINDVTGEGTCSEGEGDEGEGEPQDAEAACLAACDAFSDCGMTAEDKNGCLNDCPDLSENQQRSVASCAKDSCGDTRTCLGIDCFNDDDCGVDEQCVGNSCL